MARLRFPGRPGNRFGRTRIPYQADGIENEIDPTVNYISHIQKGLQNFRDAFGESDEEDFLGFTERDAKKAAKRLLYVQAELASELASSSKAKKDGTKKKVKKKVETRMEEMAKAGLVKPIRKITRIMELQKKQEERAQKLKAKHQSRRKLAKSSPDSTALEPKGVIRPRLMGKLGKVKGRPNKVVKVRPSVKVKQRVNKAHKTPSTRSIGEVPVISVEGGNEESFEEERDESDTKCTKTDEKPSGRRTSGRIAKSVYANLARKSVKGNIAENAPVKKHQDKSHAKKLLEKAKRTKGKFESTSKKASQPPQKKEFHLPATSMRSSRKIIPNKRFLLEDGIGEASLQKVAKPKENVEGSSGECVLELGSSVVHSTGLSIPSAPCAELAKEHTLGLLDQPLIVEGKRERKPSVKLIHKLSEEYVPERKPTEKNPEKSQESLSSTEFRKQTKSDREVEATMQSGKIILQKAKFRLNQAALNRSKAALARSLKAQMRKEDRQLHKSQSKGAVPSSTSYSSSPPEHKLFSHFGLKPTPTLPLSPLKFGLGVAASETAVFGASSLPAVPRFALESTTESLPTFQSPNKGKHLAAKPSSSPFRHDDSHVRVMMKNKYGKNCPVCDDHLSSKIKYYGVYCCRACARFYRTRSLELARRESPLICSGNGNCKMAREKKYNNCPACRYKKCQKVFPKPENIRDIQKIIQSFQGTNSKMEGSEGDVSLGSPCAKGSTNCESTLKLGKKTDQSSKVKKSKGKNSTELQGKNRQKSSPMKEIALKMELPKTPDAVSPTKCVLNMQSPLVANALSQLEDNTSTESLSVQPSTPVETWSKLSPSHGKGTRGNKGGLVSPEGGKIHLVPGMSTPKQGALEADEEVAALTTVVPAIPSPETPSKQGPRIKHVCRRAAVALGEPATFPEQLTLSALPTQEKQKILQQQVTLERPGTPDSDDMSLDEIIRQAKDDQSDMLPPSKRTPNRAFKALVPRGHRLSPGDARISAPQIVTGRRRVRCGKCDGCLARDCSKCPQCKDKPKFGGRGVMKQACVKRKCINPQLGFRGKRLSLKHHIDLETQQKGGEVAALGYDHIPRKVEAPVVKPPSSVGCVPGVRAAGKSSKIVLASVSPRKTIKQVLHSPTRQKWPSANQVGSVISVDFKEDYDIDMAWKRGLSLISSSPMCVRTVCLLCGSAGHEELLYCNVCCEPFHSFCLDPGEAPKAENSENWCCRRCQFCHVCGRQNNDNGVKELLQCDKCQDTYHPECLGPNYPTRPSKRKKIWICTKCVRCKSCGATTPGQGRDATWTYDFSLCHECGILMDKGNYCPVCHKCYSDDDWESKMIQCATCQCWVHAKCEELTDEMYQIFSYLPEDVAFNCRVCSPQRPPPWIQVISKEMAAGFKIVVDTIFSYKSANLLEGIPEQDEDACSRNSSASRASRPSSRASPRGKKTLTISSKNTSSELRLIVTTESVNPGKVSLADKADDKTEQEGQRENTVLDSSRKDCVTDRSDSNMPSDPDQNCDMVIKVDAASPVVGLVDNQGSGLASKDKGSLPPSSSQQLVVDASINFSGSSSSASVCPINQVSPLDLPTPSVVSSAEMQPPTAMHTKCESDGNTECQTSEARQIDINTANANVQNSEANKLSEGKEMIAPTPDATCDTAKDLQVDSASSSLVVQPEAKNSLILESVQSVSRNKPSPDTQIKHSVVTNKECDVVQEHSKDSEVSSQQTVAVESGAGHVSEEVMDTSLVPTSQTGTGQSEATSTNQAVEKMDTSKPCTYTEPRPELLQPPATKGSVSTDDLLALKTAVQAKLGNVPMPSIDKLNQQGTTFLKPMEKKVFPRDLKAIRKRTSENGYKNVDEFCMDIVRVIQHNMKYHDELPVVRKKATNTIRSVFIKAFEKCFPWFNLKSTPLWGTDRTWPSNMLPDSVLPPSDDHTYAQWLQRDETPVSPQPSPFKKLPNTPRKIVVPMASLDDESTTSTLSVVADSSELGDDTRKCAFCGQPGDHCPDENGRLLYAGQDDWVHVNCALWSAEVYEEVDGTLQNVHTAIGRGKKMRCDFCGKPGATVGCCQGGCPANHHFMCARAKNCLFQEDKKVFCHQHWYSTDGDVLKDNKFSIQRRACVDLSGNKWVKKPWQRGLSSDIVSVLIGSMTIEKLGRLSPLSDCKSSLYPLNFCITRVFWSTVDARRRCVYTCRIIEVNPHEDEADVIMSDMTIVHDENYPGYNKEAIIALQAAATKISMRKSRLEKEEKSERELNMRHGAGDCKYTKCEDYFISEHGRSQKTARKASKIKQVSNAPDCPDPAEPPVKKPKLGIPYQVSDPTDSSNSMPRGMPYQPAILLPDTALAHSRQRLNASRAWKERNPSLTNLSGSWPGTATSSPTPPNESGQDRPKSLPDLTGLSPATLKLLSKTDLSKYTTKNQSTQRDESELALKQIADRLNQAAAKNRSVTNRRSSKEGSVERTSREGSLDRVGSPPGSGGSTPVPRMGSPPPVARLAPGPVLVQKLSGESGHTSVQAVAMETESPAGSTVTRQYCQPGVIVQLDGTMDCQSDSDNGGYDPYHWDNLRSPSPIPQLDGKFDDKPKDENRSQVCVVKGVEGRVTRRMSNGPLKSPIEENTFENAFKAFANSRSTEFVGKPQAISCKRASTNSMNNSPENHLDKNNHVNNVSPNNSGKIDSTFKVDKEHIEDFELHFGKAQVSLEQINIPLHDQIAQKIKAESLARSSPSEQGPFKCGKCKRLYRTKESCEKHAETCTFEVSTDEDEDDEDEDNDLDFPLSRTIKVEVFPQPEVDMIAADVVTKPAVPEPVIATDCNTIIAEEPPKVSPCQTATAKRGRGRPPKRKSEVLNLDINPGDTKERVLSPAVDKNEGRFSEEGLDMESTTPSTERRGRGRPRKYQRPPEDSSPSIPTQDPPNIAVASPTAEPTQSTIQTPSLSPDREEDKRLRGRRSQVPGPISPAIEPLEVVTDPVLESSPEKTDINGRRVTRSLRSGPSQSEPKAEAIVSSEDPVQDVKTPEKELAGKRSTRSSILTEAVAENITVAVIESESPATGTTETPDTCTEEGTSVHRDDEELSEKTVSPLKRGRGRPKKIKRGIRKSDPIPANDQTTSRPGETFENEPSAPEVSNIIQEVNKQDLIKSPDTQVDNKPETVGENVGPDPTSHDSQPKGEIKMVELMTKGEGLLPKGGIVTISNETQASDITPSTVITLKSPKSKPQEITYNQFQAEYSKLKKTENVTRPAKKETHPPSTCSNTAVSTQSLPADSVVQSGSTQELTIDIPKVPVPGSDLEIQGTDTEVVKIQFSAIGEATSTTCLASLEKVENYVGPTLSGQPTTAVKEDNGIATSQTKAVPTQPVNIIAKNEKTPTKSPPRKKTKTPPKPVSKGASSSRISPVDGVKAAQISGAIAPATTSPPSSNVRILPKMVSSPPSVQPAFPVEQTLLPSPLKQYAAQGGQVNYVGSYTVDTSTLGQGMNLLPQTQILPAVSPNMSLQSNLTEIRVLPSGMVNIGSMAQQQIQSLLVNSTSNSILTSVPSHVTMATQMNCSASILSNPATGIGQVLQATPLYDQQPPPLIQQSIQSLPSGVIDQSPVNQNLVQPSVNQGTLVTNQSRTLAPLMPGQNLSGSQINIHSVNPANFTTAQLYKLLGQANVKQLPQGTAINPETTTTSDKPLASNMLRNLVTQKAKHKVVMSTSSSMKIAPNQNFMLKSVTTSSSPAVSFVTTNSNASTSFASNVAVVPSSTAGQSSNSQIRILKSTSKSDGTRETVAMFPPGVASMAYQQGMLSAEGSQGSGSQCAPHAKIIIKKNTQPSNKTLKAKKSPRRPSILKVKRKPIQPTKPDIADAKRQSFSSHLEDSIQQALQRKFKRNNNGGKLQAGCILKRATIDTSQGIHTDKEKYRKSLVTDKVEQVLEKRMRAKEILSKHVRKESLKKQVKKYISDSGHAHPLIHPSHQSAFLPEPEVEEEVEDSPLLAAMLEKEERRKAEGRKKDTPYLVFQITSDEGFRCQAESWDEAWKIVTDKVEDARSDARMKQLSFSGINGLSMFGLKHDAVIYLIEQLYGAANMRHYQFKYHQYERREMEEEPELNPSGCARAEPFISRKPFEMFSFLLSRYRHRPNRGSGMPSKGVSDLVLKSQRRSTSLDLPMAMRFRHLRSHAREAVGVYRSGIHGRGLFCKRDIDAGEMVIEYAGEVIRGVLTDQRESYYESKGIGCYMFRIDDYDVVDATLRGNSARFINHSCDPNCYSKVIQVDNKKHIVIFAQKPIKRGEELTYDYKFPIEEVKIPCTCAAKRCRKYLN